MLLNPTIGKQPRAANGGWKISDALAFNKIDKRTNGKITARTVQGKWNKSGELLVQYNRQKVTPKTTVGPSAQK